MIDRVLISAILNLDFIFLRKKKRAFIKSVKLVLSEGKFTKFVAITYPRGFCYPVEKIRNFSYVRYVREDFGSTLWQNMLY